MHKPSFKLGLTSLRTSEVNLRVLFMIYIRQSIFFFKVWISVFIFNTGGCCRRGGAAGLRAAGHSGGGDDPFGHAARERRHHRLLSRYAT